MSKSWTKHLAQNTQKTIRAPPFGQARNFSLDLNMNAKCFEPLMYDNEGPFQTTNSITTSRNTLPSQTQIYIAESSE